MKKLISLLLALFLLGALPAAAAEAPAPAPLERITHYYVDGRYGGECLISGGVPYLPAAALLRALGYDWRFEAATQAFTLYYGGHTAAFTVGEASATLDGAEVALPHAPVRLGDPPPYLGDADIDRVHVSVWAVMRLFGQSATTARHTAERDMSVWADGAAVSAYIKAGEAFYTYNITLNPGDARVADEQLTFMQGLAAPAFLHRLDAGNVLMDWGGKLGVNRLLGSLAPLTGLSRAPGRTESERAHLSLAWGIGSREALIAELTALTGGYNARERAGYAYALSRVVALSQSGYLTGWLSGDELVRFGMDAARRAQAAFASWSDYGAAMLEGARADLSHDRLVGQEARQAYVDYLYRGDRFSGLGWGVNLSEPTE